jgi:hypothetical protein
MQQQGDISMQQDEEDDDQILQDGQRMRIPMRMMDAWQHDLVDHFSQPKSRDSAHFRRRARGPRVTDAAGGTEGLHRPGWRIESGGNSDDQLMRDGAREECRRAYDEYRAELENAWRKPLTGFGSDGIVGQREVDRCVPDAKSFADGQTMDELRAAYEKELSEAWRTPR